MNAIKASIDRLTAIRLFSDSGPMFPCPFGGPKNLAASVSKSSGLNPRCLNYTKLGGEQPQVQIAETAKALYMGETKVAIICGGEAIANMKAALRAGLTLDWSKEDELDNQACYDDHGFDFSDLPIHPEELRHGLTNTISLYALSETARRLKAGLSVADYQQVIGAELEPFADVASKNPYSMFKERLSATEIATPSKDNPILVSPYTKAMVAKDGVNQGAAIIMTTWGRAKSMGFPTEKCVFLNGFSQGSEATLCERTNIDKYPVLDKIVERAFQSSKFESDDVTLADFYSCFPVVVFNSQPQLKTAKVKVPTLTGGLPFFGGPGNNYSLHAVTEMVHHIRQADGVGLVHANGGIMTKHAVGIYSKSPAVFDGVESENLNTVTHEDKVEIDSSPNGNGKLISLALQYRKNEPQEAALYLEMEDGKRALAKFDDTGFQGDLTDIEKLDKGAVFTVTSGRPHNIAKLAPQGTSLCV
jgi:acetyl-CoA C-acetyltransferase